MMVRKYATESEDGAISSKSNSPLSNDDDSLGESCNGKVNLKKGPWTSAEDAVLIDYVKRHGEGNWNAVQTQTGLARCGKSCRLRWANHLRPDLKKGAFTSEEERLIIELHSKMGNKWARMAAHLQGRTDNEIKNYWNTRIKRRQRSGQPLYPSDLYLPSPPESQLPLLSSGLSTGDFTYNNGFEKPGVTPNSFSILSQPSEYGISSSPPKSTGFSPTQCYTYTMPVLKAENDQWLDELMIQDYERGDSTEGVALVAGTQIDCHVDIFPQSLRFTDGFNLAAKPFNVNQDTHNVSKITPSASGHLTGVQKSELPSLQYQMTSSGFWDMKYEPFDAVIQSPVSEHCNFRGNTGLLQDLIYEAKALSKSESRSSNLTSSTSTNHGYATDSCEMQTYSTNYIDPTPLQAGSDSNGCTPTSAFDDVLEDIQDGSWIVHDEMGNFVDCLEYSSGQEGDALGFWSWNAMPGASELP